MKAGSIEIELLAGVARLQSDMDRATRTVGGAMQKIEQQVKRTMQVFGGLVGALSIRELARISDEYTKFTAQLKLATRNAEEFSQAYSSVLRIARSSQSDISAIGVLYARLSNNLRDLGASQSQIAGVTEAVSLALRVNGATAQESASAMLQLSQAFGAGALRSEEFNAVAENAPPLLRQLAKSLNVTYGELKGLAKEGKLTADVLAEAWNNQEYIAGLREQVKEVNTLGSATQVLRNNFTLIIGKMNELSGTGTAVGRAILSIADGMGFVADAAFGAVEMITLFGKSIAFGIKNLKELGRLLVMISNPVSLMKNLEEIPRAFDELMAFNKAYLDDVKETLNGNFTQFRDAMKKARDEAALPFDDSPLKKITASTADAKAAAKALEKAEKEKAETMKDIVTDQIRYNEAMLQYRNDLDASAMSVYELVAAQQEQNATTQRQIDVLVHGEGAVSALEVARLNETAAAYEQNVAWAQQNGVAAENIKYLEDMAANYRELADAKTAATEKNAVLESLKKQKDAVKQVAEEAKREYNRMAESLTQSITDALFRGFENGKGFLENFKDTLINAFKTLILRPQIEMIVKGSGIAGLFGSGAAFGETAGIPTQAGGGFGGILSTGKTLFEGITKGFNSLNFSITNSIAEFGANIANGMGGIRDAIGGFIGTNSSMIATSLAYLPAAFSLLKGDVKGAAFQGAGAAIGSIWGPVGAGIGAFLGGAVGSLFGKDKPKLYGATGSANYSSAGLTGSSSNFGRSLGGGALKSIEGLAAGFAGTLGGYLEGFGINSNVGASAVFRKRTNTRGHFLGSFDGRQVYLSQSYGKDGDMQSSFKDFVNKVMGPLLSEAIRKSKLPAGIRSLFSGITNRTQITNMMNATLGLQAAQSQLAERFGLTVDQAGRVAKATGLAGDALIEFVNKLAGSALAFKSQSEILLEVREQLTKDIGTLPADMDQFDAMLKAINTTTGAGIKEFQKLFALRDQFAQFTGAIDTLKAGVTGAVFGLMSPSQQLAQMQADLQTLFGNLGLSVPNSIQELMALGNSIDYTTETGLDLAAAFPSLVQAFLNTKNGVEALATSLNELDPDRFRTLVDYRRAQAYARNGISLDMLPSYDVGTAYVPQDGPAMIHQGERIFTRTENGELMRRLSSKDDGMRVLAEEVRGLREENRSMRDRLDKIADNTKRSRDVLEGSANGSTSLKTRAA